MPPPQHIHYKTVGAAWLRLPDGSIDTGMPITSRRRSVWTVAVETTLTHG